MMTTVSALALLTSVAAQSSWTLKEGFNCYEWHGATNIDVYPIGTYTIADCQAKCDETDDCTAITFMPGAEANSGNCWRRSGKINLDRCTSKSGQYDTWLKEAAQVESQRGWAQEKGVNCYKGHGASEIDHDPIGPLSVVACQDKCNIMADCTGITIETGADEGSCWRRKGINLAQCTAAQGNQLDASKAQVDTWIKMSTPAPTPAPAPSLGFPTTQPKFIRAFIEGLLSDNGTDAKQCEGDAQDFASAVEALVGTTVGEVKAVAASVDAAMKVCTVVAQDAEKLALNMLQNVFHPMRVAKNFAASRTDVLDLFGQALELMAQKDFRGAGDKVGMASRRIVEGSQDTNSQPSTEYLNQTAGNQSSTSNVVASVAVFAVTHWGAATMAQKDMPETTSANWGDFLEGLLEGLMSDGTDLSDCVGKFSEVGQALEQAKEHVGKALADVKTAADIGMRSCGVVAGDTWKIAKAAFSDILHPDRVLQNVQATQYEFLNELGEGLQALAINDYPTAGTLVGMAIRRALEGAQATIIV